MLITEKSVPDHAPKRRAASMGETSAEPVAALRQLRVLYEAARAAAGKADGAVTLTLSITPDGRITQEALSVPPPSPAAQAVQAANAMAQARARGALRVAEILAGPDMLTGADFARLIGVSREAVRQMRLRHAVLGLEGARRGVRYPAWQVGADGALLPGLARLYDTLQCSDWGIYQFLIREHPVLDGAPPRDILARGEVDAVIEAAESDMDGNFT